MELEDAPYILEIENNKDIWKVSHTQEDYTLKEIELFIAKNIVDDLGTGQKRWIIGNKNSSFGCIDLFDYDAKNARGGVGIVIHPKYQKQGIASKALDLFIALCKTKIKLHQLYCTIMQDNNHSIQLFESKGFQQTGIRTEWTLFEGKYFDELFYQLKL